MPRIGFFHVLMMAAVVGAAPDRQAQARPSAEAVARCAEEGIETAVPILVAALDAQMEKCAGQLAEDQQSARCVEDLLLEIGAASSTVSYQGHVRGALDEFVQRVTKACAGADELPYTADDVALETLHDDATPPQDGAWLAQPDAQTQVVASSELNGHPSFTSHLYNMIKQDCLPREPIEVWMKSPGLRRLLDTYQCLAVNAALTRSKKKLTIPAAAVERLRFNIVPVGITYDAGVDLLPFGAPDGVNDMPLNPFSAACSVPGIGNCLDDPGIYCSLAPKSGRRTDLKRCPKPSQICVETLSGPDGVTAADVPRGSLRRGMTTLTFTDLDAADPGDTIVELKCVVEGVRDASGKLVTSNFSGRCHDGPREGGECAGDLDCDTQVPSRYFCVDGDEYFCRADAIRRTNMDGQPACSDCVIALVTGPPSCGKAARALCIASTCVGGERDGQICNTFQFDCPGGGSCKNLREFMDLTGDEAGFMNPKLGGMGLVLCPFVTRWELPLNLLDGAGWAGLEASGVPLHICLPHGSQVDFMHGFIHEPAPIALNMALPIGIYLGPTSTSMDNVPCPSVVAVLSASLTGQNVFQGVGPIIGVNGVAWSDEHGSAAMGPTSPRDHP